MYVVSYGISIFQLSDIPTVLDTNPIIQKVGYILTFLCVCELDLVFRQISTFLEVSIKVSMAFVYGLFNQLFFTEIYRLRVPRIF